MKANELSAKDLMEGDWVYGIFSGSPQERITMKYSICSNSYEWKYIPIPITPEILEKNGFVEYDYDEGSEIPELIFGRFADNSVFVEIYGDCEHGHLEEYYPKYVHELQHALRLCGIEKEIIL